MHMQPLYRDHIFITKDGKWHENAHQPVDADIFQRGLCLPSDNKMTEQEQEIIIKMIRSCFE